MTLTKPYEATFQVGDGETKDFPFYFDEVSENFIRVIIKRADGSIYYPTFSVDMELLRVVFGEDEITPTADDVICIYRDTPAIQDTQFNTLQGYNAKALENILSKIVAMIQEMKANGFSTQILQGEPWSLDLIKPADDGASVIIDYQARVLKKGLYFKMSDGNLLASADGVNFVKMPKSENIAEFRQYTDDEGNVHFEYRVGDKWFGLATSADIADTYTKTEVDNKFVVANAQIDANADAIQKTREDLNEGLSELQTQITAQAAEIATKQDQLTAGDNIIISGNIISATGAGGGVGFDAIVVQELPESGEKGIIYLVPKDSAAPDVYDEYIWVTTTSRFELIGSTKVDLSGYVKNTDYATSATAGLVRCAQTYGMSLAERGLIQAVNANLDTYKARGNAFFIGKGTLENIKDDYVKRGITENTIVLTDAEKTAAQNWLGVGSGLPDQTDNAGKFLTTNGTEASWSDKPLVNNGDESKHNFCVGKYSATSGNYNVCVGEAAVSYGGDYNTVVGYKSQIRSTGTVIGANVQISNANKQNVAIIASGNKQMFYGDGIESDSFFWVLNGTPYKLCSSDGTIPAERIGNLDFGTMD